MPSLTKVSKSLVINELEIFVAGSFVYVYFIILNFKLY